MRIQTLHKRVLDFLEAELIYKNPHGVEMLLSMDDTVCIACNWLGKEDAEYLYVELFYEANSIAEFVTAFNLHAVKDMEGITPAFLLSLFHRGKAEISCSIDEPELFYELRFRKENNVILATSENQESHQVPELMETARQFLDYTISWFRTTEAVSYGKPVHLPE